MSSLGFSEELIEHVLRIKAANPTLTAAQVHAALTAENVLAELKDVKKAASKAAKREAAAPKAVTESELKPTPAAPSKQALKKDASMATALKAAESAMQWAQKALHEEAWMVALHGNSEETKAFMDRAAAGAISGLLLDGEVVTKERVEADLATLHYMLLPNSPFQLPEESRNAASTQLASLEKTKEVGKVASPGNAPFVAQPTFQGARPGFVFKMGESGLGYYHEAWFAAARRCYSAPPNANKAMQPEEEEEAPPTDPALREILVQMRDEAGSKKSASTHSGFSVDRAVAKAGALSLASAAGTLEDID